MPSGQNPLPYGRGSVDAIETTEPRPGGWAHGKMKTRKLSLRPIAVIALLCAAPAAFAAKKESKITIEVRNQNNQPVDRASVIVKPMRGKHVKASYELRTTQQGTAPLPPLHQGTFLIQIIADGYQTYGGQFVVDEPEKTIQIKLSPPQSQYSVHGPMGGNPPVAK